MRIGAIFVALAAAVSLGAQWLVSAGLMPAAGPVGVLWRMLGYFTVLGNLATLVLMAGVAFNGRISAKTSAAITIVMAMVGMGYHILLAGIWAHQGLAWWADQGLHTAVPLLMVLWWAVFAPKGGLAGRDAFVWLIWPIGYAAYALVRGLAAGFYPYPFIDVGELGMMQALLNIGVLGLCFVALSLLLIGIARVIR